MSTHRQSIRDYIRACEVLLQASELTVAEQEAVETMIGRLQIFIHEHDHYSQSEQVLLQAMLSRLSDKVNKAKGTEDPDRS